MAWLGLFVPLEPLGPPGPAVLSPQQALEHLETHVAWEERRLMRHCCWALALLAAGGTVTLLTGWLTCLVVSTVMAVTLLVVEKRRWDRRRLPGWLVQGLARWADEQQDPGRVVAELKGLEGTLEWHQLVNEATRGRKANPA